jgi:protein-tyrosine phosphatase
MNGRILNLEGVDNFRDFGDYAVGAGARIRPGQLYRSAHHGRATDADLDAIAALGVAVVVDLRRASERRREPSRRHAAFAGQVIDNDLGDVTDDPWWTFVRGSDLSAAAFRGYLMDYYRAAPFEPRHMELFARYFRALGEAPGPVLIHCAAGKDRTGLLAALTHHLAGVHHDDIVADYLLTNDVARLERRAPQVAQLMFEAAGRRPTSQAVRAAMGVEAAYLHAAFAAIDQAYGGLDAYLEQALGVDAASRARVRGRLVV